MRDRAPFSGPLALIVGFSLWALAFVALYAAHGFSCAAGFNGVRWILAGLWLILLAAGGGLVFAFLRKRVQEPKDAAFLRRLGLILAIAALGAMLWTGIPTVLLETC